MIKFLDLQKINAQYEQELKIAAKEASETDYWLRLSDKSKSYPNTELLIKDLLGVKKVLGKIIASTKRNK